ncbi:MAG: hypothetical protein CVV27_14575 [Candidatus Melainabacteria bacterium HGW-Melainabacteria-1]|nr:MAG: hypothetical protein CVV27_14575 [Candidatus Melainabacteria bacterium HGW-Melainabacteria-1]
MVNPSDAHFIPIAQNPLLNYQRGAVPASTGAQASPVSPDGVPSGSGIAPDLPAQDQLESPLSQGNSLASLPLGTDESPPQASFAQLAGRNKGYLKPEQPSDRAALQSCFSQGFAWLEQQPELKARVAAKPGGADFLAVLQAGAQGQISPQSIETLQRFLAVTEGINLRFGGHATGIDGKYGPVTHQGLLNYFNQLQNTGAANTSSEGSRSSNQPPVNHAVTQPQASAPDLPASAPGLPASVGPTPDSAEQVAQWQALAGRITEQGKRGQEMHARTEPIYARLLEQVRDTTREVPASEDPLPQRQHSIRPRVGTGYTFSQGSFRDAQGQPAQAAAMVFDREHNLMAALDARGQIIMAVEARNNTNQHFAGRSEDWLTRNSIVPETNAPAPNGVYAIGDVLRDNASSGKTFGSNKIIIEGGVITQREILIHSRDHHSNKEIPWDIDQNTLTSRSAGCVLLQDPDLQLLSRLLKQADESVALVIQGSYAKNLDSPEVYV